MRKIKQHKLRCKNCNSLVKTSNLYRHLNFRCPKIKIKIRLKVKVKRKRLHFTSETYSSEYLQSTHWKLIKDRFYKLFFYCQLCGNTRQQLNIHHLTYKNLGYELNGDLIVLCESCHIEKVHKKIVKRKVLIQIVKCFWGEETRQPAFS